MLIFWGTGDGVAELGEMKARVCPSCGVKAPSTAYVEYTYNHIWLIIRWIDEKKYMAVCQNCGAQRSVNKEWAEALFPNDNIPSKYKYGWITGLGVVGAIVALYFYFRVWRG